MEVAASSKMLAFITRVHGDKNYNHNLHAFVCRNDLYTGFLKGKE
jgi:hypothetical protein